MVVGWGEIETEKGKRDFQKLDGLIEDLTETGIRIMVTFLSVPEWASEMGEENAHPCSAPMHDEDWAEFVYTVAARYHGRVSYWEIWNEENEYYFFQPQPDPVRYTSMLKAAYQACKRADPNCTVVLGGLCFNGIVANPWSPMKTENYLPALYEAGAKQWFDVLAIHPYFLAREGVPRLAALVDGTKQAMEKAGDGQKPIWITEIGFAIKPDNVSDEEEQARLFVAAVEFLRKDPQIGPIFYFSLQDWPASVFGGENTMGLITLDDRRKKPVFSAFQSLARPSSPTRGAKELAGTGDASQAVPES